MMLLFLINVEVISQHVTQRNTLRNKQERENTFISLLTSMARSELPTYLLAGLISEVTNRKKVYGKLIIQCQRK